MSNLSDSKLGKTIQKSKVPFSIYIQYDIQLGWEYLTTQLDPRWTMKLQHLLTIQTSHCRRMSVENMTSWHVPAAFSDSAEPTTQQALAPSSPIWVVFQSDARDGTVYLQCLGQGLEAATDQGWRLVRGPLGQNLISEMLKQKDIQLETCRISLIQNLEKQSRNPRFHSASTYSVTYSLGWEYLTTQFNPRWTMKLQHLLTIQTSHCKRMSVENMTSWHAAAFSDSAEPTTHQALAPSAPIWLPPKLMFVTDPFIFSASAKAWRQRQIKVGVLSKGPSDKTWFLKCSNKKTFNWDMSNLSETKLGKTMQKSHSFIQHPHTAGLGAFHNSTRSEMNDETTAPANHPNFSL